MTVVLQVTQSKFRHFFQFFRLKIDIEYWLKVREKTAAKKEKNLQKFREIKFLQNLSKLWTWSIKISSDCVKMFKIFVIFLVFAAVSANYFGDLTCEPLNRPNPPKFSHYSVKIVRRQNWNLREGMLFTICNFLGDTRIETYRVKFKVKTAQVA